MAVLSFMDLAGYGCYNNAVQQSLGEYVVAYSIAPIKQDEEVNIPMIFSFAYMWVN